MKICTKCKKNEVYLKDKYPSYCLECKKQNNREKYNNKSYLEKRYIHAKKNYKIDKNTFDKLMTINTCQICNIFLLDKDKNIDHCHNTNKVRSILCANCNYAIGFFKDDINLLNKAIEYLLLYK